MNDFEKIVLDCIVYYNSKRIVENFPYTEDMLKADIKPFSSCIWDWCRQNNIANSISVDIETVILTLFPRTTGMFTRYGLKVNGLRYKHDKYTEQYLQRNKVTVAYAPDNVSYVWLIHKGKYERFELIESRFKECSLNDIENQPQNHLKMWKTEESDVF